MQFASSLIWLRRLVVVGSVVACAAASAIGASASPTVGAPDVVERYAATDDLALTRQTFPTSPLPPTRWSGT